MTHRSDQPPGVVVPAGRADRHPPGWLDRAGREALLSDALRAASGGRATVAVVVSWLHRAYEHRP